MLSHKIRVVWLSVVFANLISIPTYARPLEPNVKLIYCADKVECPTSGNVNQCHVSPEKQTYVDSVISINGVTSGDYVFSGADANYHYQYPHAPSVSGAVCHYQKEDSFIDVYYKKISNIEVYYDNSTKWNISGHTKFNEPDAFCQSSDPTLCPLITKPELVIDTEKQSISTSGATNGLHIKDLIQNSDPNHPQQFLTINYNEALAACGNTDKCEIRIDGHHLPLGKVIVDIINGMSIVSIIYPEVIIECNSQGVCYNKNQYHLKQYTPFNTLGITTK